MTDPPLEDPTRVLIHDLRNMLAIIVQYCELIPDELDNPEALKADVKEIREAAERAIELTQKIPRPTKQST